jgi:hypothetical protein
MMQLRIADSSRGAHPQSAIINPQSCGQLGVRENVVYSLIGVLILPITALNGVPVLPLAKWAQTLDAGP